MPLACALALSHGLPANGQPNDWITFTDETWRLIGLSTIGGSADTAEKDMAVGDLDQDGRVDLVVVRKDQFYGPEAKRNVLFMNVVLGGTSRLRDRTAALAPAMLDQTSDRDVVIVDLNHDTWLDVVTAATDGDPPRVYMNLGSSGGSWLGLHYDPAENRIPAFSPPPKFCAVAAGDLNGDFDIDLYFVDYGNLEDRLLINDGNGFFTDETEARMTLPVHELICTDVIGVGCLAAGGNCILGPCNGTGTNLDGLNCFEPVSDQCVPAGGICVPDICRGTEHFDGVDCTTSVKSVCEAAGGTCPVGQTCTGADPAQGGDFLNGKLCNNPFSTVCEAPATGGSCESVCDGKLYTSLIGTGAVIADLNGDFAMDIIKSENGPVHVIYNDGSGNFNRKEVLSSTGSYMVGVASFDGELPPDVYVINDTADRYMLNVGNGADGFADFTVNTAESNRTASLGGNVGFADLDGDNFDDVLVSDIDLTNPTCDRQLALFRNQTDSPFDSPPTICDPFRMTTEPAWLTRGTFDTAVIPNFDAGRPAIYSGTCTGSWLFKRVQADGGQLPFVDCNGNDNTDSCDIQQGVSKDCDGDGVPDECHGCSCVYDDVCEFRICEGSSQCQITPAAYGDMAGPGGTCGPDGDVTLPDILSVLNAFSGIFRDCCTLENHDITGDIDICTPDGVIDLRDIDAVNNAFAGTDPCCAQGFAQSGGSGGVAGAGGEAVLILVPRQENPQAGGLFEIDIFVANVADLRGYQLAMEIDATAAGNVTLEAIHIDEQRTDHVFARLEYQHAIDIANSRMVASLPQGGATPQVRAYLATFAFRLSPEARGMSVVRVLRGGASIMLDSAGRSMELLGSADATISVP